MTRALHRRFYQSGAVLGIALLLLTTLTLLAVFASQLTRSREMSAGMSQEREIALQSAEAALSAAERLLLSQTAADDSCTGNGRCRIYAPRFTNAAELGSLSWWERFGWAYTEMSVWIPADDATVKGYSAFVIEKVAFVPDSLSISPTENSTGQTFFRVTALARPSPRLAPVILQSTYLRRDE